jgi:hypothetical protein
VLALVPANAPVASISFAVFATNLHGVNIKSLPPLAIAPFSTPAAFFLQATAPRGVNLEIVIPLALSCLAIMIILPVSAARGRLHIPGWVGFALFSFVLSYTCARISGVQSFVGRPTGVFFSIACFLFLAAALGSVLALFFYKDPPGV